VACAGVARALINSTMHKHSIGWRVPGCACPVARARRRVPGGAFRVVCAGERVPRGSCRVARAGWRVR